MCCRDNKLEGVVKEIYREGEKVGNDFYRAVAACMWDKEASEVTEAEYQLVKRNLQSALGEGNKT